MGWDGSTGADMEYFGIYVGLFCQTYLHTVDMVPGSLRRALVPFPGCIETIGIGAAVFQKASSRDHTTARSVPASRIQSHIIGRLKYLDVRSRKSPTTIETLKSTKASASSWSQIQPPSPPITNAAQPRAQTLAPVFVGTLETLRISVQRR